jgi:ribosomal 50S subunit-recycling heat shock protein
VRLDLFLKTSRLIKRRTVARETCEKGGILVNGLEAKPAKEVKPGDRITLKFSTRIIELEVLEGHQTSSRISPAKELYRVLSEMRTQKNREL